MTVTSEQAELEFAALLSRAETGEIITIERDGQPVVELRPVVPLIPIGGKRIFGMLEGKGVVPDDIKTPYEAEINEMFYGE
jgi:antitoxin (DNA-binding transcriptional repressor) of toxin-antitoxin stability system